MNREPDSDLPVGIQEWTVHYEVTVNMGKAPLARLMRACLRYRARVRDTMCFGKPDTPDQHRSAVVLVQVDLRVVDGFIKDAAPIACSYKSPSVVSDGNLVAKYKGALDEIRKRHKASSNPS